MAQQMSVQDYLVKYFPAFWKSLTGKVVAEKDCLNECLYHSDKANQYWSLWADAGIHPFNGTMLYLLTYEAPWSDECRKHSPTPNGSDRHWFGPCDWVIANYGKFREHLPHAVSPVKQTKVRITDDAGKIIQRGNCMASALAIMTNRSIDDVPAIETMGTSWHLPLFKWLKEIGYTYSATQNPSGLLIANGMSCRGIAHSIITVDGKFFHDPHPNESYLDSISQYWRITPIVLAEHGDIKSRNEAVSII
jgi:hypothetical protein